MHQYTARSALRSIIRPSSYMADPESLQTSDRTAGFNSKDSNTAALKISVMGNLWLLWRILPICVGGHNYSYSMKTKKFEEEVLPPPGMHLVLGIFDDSGILLDEVILYTGGPSITKQLVKARRGLFSLPILRDIKAFGLYKV